MHRTFPTIRDYHHRAPEIDMQNSEWGTVRASVLIEGSGDIRFARVDRNALVLTLDGTARHLTRMDGICDATPSQPGDICVIPRGVELHLAWTNRDTLQKTVMVEFDEAIFANFAPEVLSDAFSRGHMMPSNFAQRPTLEPLMKLLSREVGGYQRRGRLFGETLIRLIALEVASGCWSVAAHAPPAPNGPDPRVNRALDFVEARFAEDVSLVDIAAAAGLSPTHLTGMFRRETGMTPYSYVINRRLRQAVHLLRSTDTPIAQVALDAGFADQQHLTRMVRARLRKTPKQVRDE
jgi:AraC family transcriptional regulator